MIEQEVIEYNSRQVALMENRIKLYKNNQITTKAFIDDIDALIAWIQGPPNDWVKALKGILWEIEIIYAWALDQEKELTTEERAQISSFVDKIEERIIWYKQNCLPPINDNF